jgi:uncharacterized RDD family membrane protein YckC
LEFPLAGIGSRSLGIAIDTLLQVGAAILLLIVAGLISAAGFLPQMGKQWGYAILVLAGFVVEFGYFAFFEAVWNGQTPGKRWTHLRVIGHSGRPVGVQEVILRNLLRIVDSLPALYAIGIITCLISQQNKRLGDYLAGTVVVREKPLEKGQLPWDRSATPLPASAQPIILTLAELQVVEAFLERRQSLQNGVRRSIARQIVERLMQGRSIPSENVQDAERLLQSLAEHSRDTLRFR